MSDGVELGADIYFPSKAGVVDLDRKYPVMLQRTPYMDTMPIMNPFLSKYYFTEKGFVVVRQAVRGTHFSDGVYQPGFNESWGGKTDGYGEHTDGKDTIVWINEQPWSSGEVFTFGESYMGHTAYTASLCDNLPGVMAAACCFPYVKGFDSAMPYTAGDFLNAATTVLWSFGEMREKLTFERLCSQLPEETVQAIMADNEMLGDPLDNPTMTTLDWFEQLQRDYSYEEMPILRHVPWYRAWLENRENPNFFATGNPANRTHTGEHPVLFIGGWYDVFLRAYMKSFEQAEKEVPPDKASNYRLIVGAWNHCPNPLVRSFPGTESDERMMIHEWVSRFMEGGEESEFFKENPVSLFVMGENRWRSEPVWPIADARPLRFYLRGKGAANTLSGDGWLCVEAPSSDEAFDQYAYDPKNPVVSPGGNAVGFGGQCDQRSVEMRSDVLVYTSDVLDEEVEVTGWPEAVIYASTSAEDTDFVVKILDVCPDGTVYNVVTGARRGRYIQAGRTNPKPLEPGKVYAWEIELYPTSYVFKAGHRIRVDVTSSDAYNLETNPNVFMDLNKAKPEDCVIANQAVYHDAEHASYVELPVVPASHVRTWIDPWPFSSSLTGIDFENPFPYMEHPALNAPYEYDGSEL